MMETRMDFKLEVNLRQNFSGLAWPGVMCRKQCKRLVETVVMKRFLALTLRVAL